MNGRAALLAELNFGLWLASGLQRTVQKQRETVEQLQGESVKRQQILAGLHDSIAKDQR